MVQESQSIDSIYDFLYVDTPRVKSWLAQLLNDGVPLGHKRTLQSGDVSSEEIGGGVDIATSANAILAKAEFKGSAQGKVASQELSSSAKEQSFDASWSLPLNLLDRLSELRFIHPDITRAPIGGLVLNSGTPRLLDIKLLREVWTPGTGLMEADTKLTHQNKTQHIAARAKMKSVGDIIKAMPPQAQISLIDEDQNQIWACLQDEHLVVTASSLALTHGASISGTWHVLAVLDAKPDQDEPSVPAVAESSLMEAASTLLASVRGLMGRNPASYGVTPLLIFRSVSLA